MVYIGPTSHIYRFQVIVKLKMLGQSGDPLFTSESDVKRPSPLWKNKQIKTAVDP